MSKKQNLKRHLLSVLGGALVFTSLSPAHAEDFDRIYQVKLQLNSTPVISQQTNIIAKLNLSPNPGVRTKTWRHHFQSTGDVTIDQYNAMCHLTSDKVGASDDGTVTCTITAELSKDVKNSKTSSTETVKTFLSKMDLDIQLKGGMADVQLPENKYFTGKASVRVISS